MRLTIRHRIIGSFMIVLSLMMLVGGVALQGLSQVQTEATSQIDDSLLTVSYSLQLRSLWRDNNALSVRHIVSAETQQEVEAQIHSKNAEMRQLLSDFGAKVNDPTTLRELEDFKMILAVYQNLQKQMLSLSNAKESEQASKFLRNTLDPEWNKGFALLKSIVDRSQSKADASAGSMLRTAGNAKASILVGLTVAVLLAGVCGYFLLASITEPLRTLMGVIGDIRHGDFTKRITQERHDEFGTLNDGFNRMIDEVAGLVGQIQKTSLQVASSAMEVAATAKQQLATINDIAATTTEIGAASTEISATSKDLVHTMNEVSGVADQSATLAGDSQAGLIQMEHTMRHVVEAAGSINTKLAVLNEKADTITQVITTITKVADQTNLLSLNAAIEAEKAAEYGRGFAVVATEIRRLADQTAVATYDIEQMVKEIQAAVSASVMGMDKFSEEVRRGMQEIHMVGNQLSQIIQQVQKLVPRFESVSEGMQAQAVGAGQITDSLSQLSEAAQQTVQSLHQSNAAIDELNNVASTLRAGVSRFKLQA